MDPFDRGPYDPQRAFLLGWATAMCIAGVVILITGVLATALR